VTFLEQASYIPVIGVAVTGILLVLSDRRVSILIIVAVQYLLASLLVWATLSLQVAAARLVTGLVVTAILGLAVRSVGMGTRFSRSRILPTGRAFRLISALLIAVAAIGIARGPWVDILELPEVISLGALVMAGLGLLQVGLFDAPLRIGVGLLTIIAGFEVAYGLIEPSLAITALFALVNVGIALVTSYLVMLAAEQGSEEAGL
jgi:hypothetical protein